MRARRTWLSLGPSTTNTTYTGTNMSSPCRNNPTRATNDTLSLTLAAPNKQIADRYREHKAARMNDEVRADAATHADYHQRIAKPVRFSNTEAKNAGMREEIGYQDQSIPGYRRARVQGG